MIIYSSKDLSIVQQVLNRILKVPVRHFALKASPNVILVYKPRCFCYFFHQFINNLRFVSPKIDSFAHTSHLISLRIAPLIKFDVILGEDTFVSNLVSDKYLEEMVCNWVMLFNLFNFGTNNGFFFLKHSNWAEDFDICVFPVDVVLESHWGFIFSFLIENNFEPACIVVNFDDSSHVFINFSCDTAHNDDLLKIQIYKNCKLLVLTSWIPSPSISQISSGLEFPFSIICSVTGTNCRPLLFYCPSCPPNYVPN